MSALFSGGNVSCTLKSIESIEESAPHWSASIFHFIRRRTFLSPRSSRGRSLSVHSAVGSRRYYPSRLITLYSEMAVVSKDDKSGHAAWKWNKRVKRDESYGQFVLHLKSQWFDRLLLTQEHILDTIGNIIWITLYNCSRENIRSRSNELSILSKAR